MSGVLDADPRNVDSDLIEGVVRNVGRHSSGRRDSAPGGGVSHDRIMAAAGSCGGPGWTLHAGRSEAEIPV
ncbi:hypothetical protein GCM10010399_42390 [Dactylosporangium fulvum]